MWYKIAPVPWLLGTREHINFNHFIYRLAETMPRKRGLEGRGWHNVSQRPALHTALNRESDG